MDYLENFKKSLLAELKKEFKDEFMIEFMQVIKDVIEKEKLLMPNVQTNTFEHMDYFLKQYRISRKTFHKWKKGGYVSKKRVGRFNVYNVIQFEKAAAKANRNPPRFKQAA